jgi:hypothetical protein
MKRRFYAGSLAAISGGAVLVRTLMKKNQEIVGENATR